MCVLSVSVVLTMYLLAIGRRWVSGVLVVGAAALTGAVLAAHGAAKATATADLMVQVGPPVITTGFTIVHYRRRQGGGLRRTISARRRRYRAQHAAGAGLGRMTSPLGQRAIASMSLMRGMGTRKRGEESKGGPVGLPRPPTISMGQRSSRWPDGPA